VELDGASYAGFALPFSITQLVWIEAILVGGAEIYRNTELDTEKRLYPGGSEWWRSKVHVSRAQSRRGLSRGLATTAPALLVGEAVQATRWRVGPCCARARTAAV
jgi:hypothetical protein